MIWGEEDVGGIREGLCGVLVGDEVGFVGEDGLYVCLNE